MNEGPSDLMKLPLHSRTQSIYYHPEHPILLASSKSAILAYNTEHQALVNNVKVEAHSEEDTISNLQYANGCIIYSTDQSLSVNHNVLKLHKCRIEHILSDESGVLLTSARSENDRSIKVTWCHEEKSLLENIAEYQFHHAAISSIYWKNSLVISGDCRGDLCLWDLNKVKTISHKKCHYDPIEFIGAHVDYTVNNIFYTVAPEEKRLVFSDLRTSKAIKIITGLSSQKILSVENTPSGKILIACEESVQVLDIQSDYGLKGLFAPVERGNVSEMSKRKEQRKRKIKKMKVIGKYAIVACDNGCIEVYDTDLMQCLYGFGLTKYGPIQDLQVNGIRGEILGLDASGEVYMAKFGCG